MSSELSPAAVSQVVGHRSPDDATEAVPLVSPLAVRKIVDRLDRVAATEARHPGLLRGILAGLRWNP